MQLPSPSLPEQGVSPAEEELGEDPRAFLRRPESLLSAQVRRLSEQLSVRLAQTHDQSSGAAPALQDQAEKEESLRSRGRDEERRDGEWKAPSPAGPARQTQTPRSREPEQCEARQMTPTTTTARHRPEDRLRQPHQRRGQTGQSQRAAEVPVGEQNGGCRQAQPAHSAPDAFEGGWKAGTFLCVFKRPCFRFRVGV